MWDLKHDTNELIYETAADADRFVTDRGVGAGEGCIGSWDEQMQTIMLIYM